VTAELRGPRSRRWPARLAWMLWALAVLGLVLIVWLDQLLRRTGRPELVVLRARHHRHGDRLQRLGPAAHPDRDAGVAPLALAGGDRRGHTGPPAAGPDRARRLRRPARPGARQPARPQHPRRRAAGRLPGRLRRRHHHHGGGHGLPGRPLPSRPGRRTPAAALGGAWHRPRRHAGRRAPVRAGAGRLRGPDWRRFRWLPGPCSLGLHPLPRTRCGGQVGPAPARLHRQPEAAPCRACGRALPVAGQAGLDRTGRAAMPWSRNLRRT
jgi:hypothetical protein